MSVLQTIALYTVCFIVGRYIIEGFITKHLTDVTTIHKAKKLECGPFDPDKIGQQDNG